MKAADVMTRQVFTVRDDAPLADAVRLMLQHRISGMPVLDAQGALCGVLTEGDLLRRAETGTERKRSRWLEFVLGPGKTAGEYVHAHGRRVSEVMTREVATIAPDTPLADVVAQMERRRVKRLPVVEDGRLVGIVSRANLVQALLAVADEVPPVKASDEEIRDRLWTELEKSGWAPVGLINLIVRDGVVDLYGTVTDGREGEALRVAAENVPGVREVRNHLAWCDPLTGTLVTLADDEVQAAGRR